MGWSDSAHGCRAFLWQAGRLTDLGAPDPGPDLFHGGGYSRALGISRDGMIVGEEDLPAPQDGPDSGKGILTRVVFWRDGRRLVPALPAGFEQSLAGGVNGRGQILLQAESEHVGSRFRSVTFVWQAGRLTRLPPPRGED